MNFAILAAPVVLRPLVTPPAVEDPSVPDLLRGLDRAEQAVAEADRLADTFFAAYHRFLGPFWEGKLEVVHNACEDVTTARSFFVARRQAQAHRREAPRGAAVERLGWHGPPEGLTPMVRRRLDRLAGTRSRAAQMAALIAALEHTMRRELLRRGCDPPAVEALGATLPEIPPAPREVSIEPSPGTVRVSIENQGCDRVFTVFVDGRVVGRARAADRAEIETPEGWHRFCLGPADGASCGAAEHHAVVYLHERFSVRPHCE